MGTVRGLLKIYGIKAWQEVKDCNLFFKSARSNKRSVSKDSIEALVCSLEIIEESI